MAWITKFWRYRQAKIITDAMIFDIECYYFSLSLQLVLLNPAAFAAMCNSILLSSPVKRHSLQPSYTAWRRPPVGKLRVPWHSSPPPPRPPLKTARTGTPDIRKGGGREGGVTEDTRSDRAKSGPVGGK